MGYPNSSDLDCLIQIAAKGGQILGIEKKEDYTVVTLMAPVSIHSWDADRIVYLYKLPIQHSGEWICFMGLRFSSNCCAYIYDWSSRLPNMGYGSILMKHLISFLRIAGFRSLTGNIRSTDFDNENMLRHFYSKFGFEITDYPDRRRLHLNLLDEENKAVHHDGHLVCCRTLERGLLEMDQMLEQAETQ